MKQVKTYFRRHLQVFFHTLGQFSAQKVSTALTILALGIGLSIPAILLTLADGLSAFGGQWQGKPQISMYLKLDLPSQQIDALSQKISAYPDVDEVKFISKEQGLNDFTQHGEFKDIVAQIDSNPLPDVLVVYPREDVGLEGIEALTTQLRVEQGVQHAQYDLDWLKRLNAIETFIKRAVYILSIIISIGLVLLIANTIRLEIANRQSEIDIIDQLGGTPAFVKRPFLYMGALEGFFGGLCALLIAAGVLVLLSTPIQKLSQLYDIQLGLSGLHWQLSLLLLVFSTLLGWLAAQFTISRTLSELRPQ